MRKRCLGHEDTEDASVFPDVWEKIVTLIEGPPSPRPSQKSAAQPSESTIIAAALTIVSARGICDSRRVDLGICGYLSA